TDPTAGRHGGGLRDPDQFHCQVAVRRFGTGRLTHPCLLVCRVGSCVGLLQRNRGQRVTTGSRCFHRRVVVIVRAVRCAAGVFPAFGGCAVRCVVSTLRDSGECCFDTFPGTSEMLFADVGQSLAAFPQRQRLVQREASGLQLTDHLDQLVSCGFVTEFGVLAVFDSVAAFGSAGVRIGVGSGCWFTHVRGSPEVVACGSWVPAPCSFVSVVTACTAPSPTRIRSGVSVATSVTERSTRGAPFSSVYCTTAYPRPRVAVGPSAFSRACHEFSAVSSLVIPASTSLRARSRAVATSSARRSMGPSGSASTGRARSCSNSLAWVSTHPCGALRARSRSWAPRLASSTTSGSRRVPASVGVEQRRSATWSSSGLPGSCPIAPTIGVPAAPTARHNASSENGNRSSTLPPPR